LGACGNIREESPAAAATAPKLTLMIKGRKLSKTASFKIDGKDVELAKHQYKVDASAADADEQSATPIFTNLSSWQLISRSPAG
jgi:hypothetical protein